MLFNIGKNKQSNDLFKEKQNVERLIHRRKKTGIDWKKNKLKVNDNIQLLMMFKSLKLLIGHYLFIDNIKIFSMFRWKKFYLKINLF